MIGVARLLLPLAVFASCATATVDMNEPRRLVGTENSVRVDVEVIGDELTAGTPLPLRCEITNQRDSAIAVADIIPETTYDADAQMITVGIGSEVPGASTLPRLILIQPGEKKTITTTARVLLSVAARSADPNRPFVPSLRVKVNFLRDTAPFADLAAMTQKALVDPKRADELFPLWLERNEAVYTNAIPMRWVGNRNAITGPPPRRPVRGF